MKNIFNAWRQLDAGRKFICVGIPTCTVIEISRTASSIGVMNAVKDNFAFVMLGAFILLFIMTLPNNQK